MWNTKFNFLLSSTSLFLHFWVTQLTYLRRKRFLGHQKPIKMKKKTLFGLCDSSIISTYTYPHGAFCYLLLSSQVYFAILVTHSNVNTLCLSLSNPHTWDCLLEQWLPPLSLSLSLSLYMTHTNRQSNKRKNPKKEEEKKNSHGVCSFVPMEIIWMVLMAAWGWKG